MPKKFKGENSKAAEARARKESKRQEELEKKQKALEDEYWRDDDKHALRKQQRKVCAVPLLAQIKSNQSILEPSNRKLVQMLVCNLIL